MNITNTQEELFEEIKNGNVILFLGAGASVTDDKIYLSRHLIEYYKDIKNISYDPKGDIVDFVDKVFSVNGYDRDDFDSQIGNWLRNNLKIANHHKIITNTPWLSIITTNVDYLIENSIEDQGVENKYEIIRSLQELNKSMKFGDKTKYIKLHGCISDISKYKLAFSSSDFENSNKYYKRIFNILKDQSPKVKILFIGYSFSDRFGMLFLNKYMEELKNREFYLVNPYIKKDDFTLSYYKSKNINLIWEGSDSFFEKYSDWLLNNQTINIQKTNLFKKADGTKINSFLQYKLKPFLIPLNNTYKTKEIKAKEYYLGEEPNYSIINSEYDVIRKSKINELIIEINKLFKNNDISHPLVYLKGSYGTGKTTFTYRLIQKIIENSDKCTVAFEIFNFEKISIKILVELIESLVEVKNIIFYSNHLELDLNFKKIREVRGQISSRQFVDKSIIFLQSIRENALERFKIKLNPNIYEFHIDEKMSRDELSDYIDKLNINNIINYRSVDEKKRIIDDTIINQNLNEQLLVSLALIKGGSHIKPILDTYNNFEFESTKKAFLYTSLLFKYGIKMPLSLLKEIIDKDWDTFLDEIIKVDGKGIFIQEEIKPDKFLKPDLYFRIKHSIIADNFIKSQLKRKNIFNLYQNLISRMPENDTSVTTFINLIKALKNDSLFDKSKINRLYDIAYKRLNNFRRFIIYYSRNLQYRNNESKLIMALRILESEEALNDKDNIYRRDKIIIHRKASVNYQLSKFYIDKNIDKSLYHFNEAYDFFDIKLALDPNSVFSYKNFINMLLWYLKEWKRELSEHEIIKIEYKISQIIKKGLTNLQEGIESLLKAEEYINKYWERKSIIKERIDTLNEKIETRPYALLLRFELFERNGDTTYDLNEDILIEELENYTYNEDVALFLFHYYGENLNDINIRLKFFNHIRNNEFLEKKEELMVLYYSFIAESYSYRMKDAFELQQELSDKFRYAIRKNPIFWNEQQYNKKRVFSAKIIKTQKGYFNLKIKDMGGNFYAKLNNKNIGNIKNLLSMDVKAHLYFSYSGIWGKIIQ